VRQKNEYSAKYIYFLSYDKALKNRKDYEAEFKESNKSQTT